MFHYLLHSFELAFNLSFFPVALTYHFCLFFLLLICFLPWMGGGLCVDSLSPRKCISDEGIALHSRFHLLAILSSDAAMAHAPRICYRIGS